MFTVLEGVNGSGKSSTLVLLGERGLRVWAAPMLSMASPRSLVMQSAAPLSRFMFFMALNYQVGSEIAAFEGGEPCVASRYLWSSVAYHAAREGIEDLQEIQWLLDVGAGLELPTRVIQLEVSREAQVDRLRSRNLQGGARYGVTEAQFWGFDDRMRRMFALLRETALVPWHVIDTSLRSVGDVADEVAELAGTGP